MAAGKKGSATYRKGARTRKASAKSGTTARQRGAESRIAARKQQVAAERASKKGAGGGRGGGSLRAAAPKGPGYGSKAGTYTKAQMAKMTPDGRRAAARVNKSEAIAKANRQGKLTNEQAAAALNKLNGQRSKRSRGPVPMNNEQASAASKAWGDKHHPGVPIEFWD